MLDYVREELRETTKKASEKRRHVSESTAMQQLEVLFHPLVRVCVEASETNDIEPKSEVTTDLLRETC